MLKGINLEVDHGETLVIISPSACGKTVLLKCIIGLLKPDSGTRRIYGEDTASFSNRDRELFKADAGMLFQQSALFVRQHDSLEKYRVPIRSDPRHGPNGSAADRGPEIE